MLPPAYDEFLQFHYSIVSVVKFWVGRDFPNQDWSTYKKKRIKNSYHLKNASIPYTPPPMATSSHRLVFRRVRLHPVTSQNHNLREMDGEWSGFSVRRGGGGGIEGFRAAKRSEPLAVVKAVTVVTVATVMTVVTVVK
jgi:hypothetical protein